MNSYYQKNKEEILRKTKLRHKKNKELRSIKWYWSRIQTFWVAWRNIIESEAFDEEDINYIKSTNE